MEPIGSNRPHGWRVALFRKTLSWTDIAFVFPASLYWRIIYPSWHELLEWLQWQDFAPFTSDRYFFFLLGIWTLIRNTQPRKQVERSAPIALPWKEYTYCFFVFFQLFLDSLSYSVPKLTWVGFGCLQPKHPDAKMPPCLFLMKFL